MRKVCICSSCGPTNCKQCKFVNYDGKWEKQRSKNDGENLYQWYFLIAMPSLYLFGLLVFIYMHINVVLKYSLRENNQI